MRRFEKEEKIKKANILLEERMKSLKESEYQDDISNIDTVDESKEFKKLKQLKESFDRTYNKIKRLDEDRYDSYKYNSPEDYHGRASSAEEVEKITDIEIEPDVANTSNVNEILDWTYLYYTDDANYSHINSLLNLMDNYSSDEKVELAKIIKKLSTFEGSNEEIFRMKLDDTDYTLYEYFMEIANRNPIPEDGEYNEQ